MVPKDEGQVLADSGEAFVHGGSLTQMALHRLQSSISSVECFSTRR